MEVLDLKDYYHIPEKLFDTIKLFLEDNINFIIAGGSISNLYHFNKLDDDQDIDIFFENKDDFLKADNILLSKKDEILFDYETRYAKTYYDLYNSRKIQLIRKHFKPVEEILDDFDLGCCKIALKDNKIYNKSTKNIEISRVNSDTFQRVFKYYKRGFKITENDKKLINNSLLKNEDLESYYDGKKIDVKKIFMLLLIIVHDNKREDFIKEIFDEQELNPALLELFLKIDFYLFEKCNYNARIAKCIKTGKYYDEVYKRNPEFLV